MAAAPFVVRVDAGWPPGCWSRYALLTPRRVAARFGALRRCKSCLSLRLRARIARRISGRPRNRPWNTGRNGVHPGCFAQHTFGQEARTGALPTSFADRSWRGLCPWHVTKARLFQLFSKPRSPFDHSILIPLDPSHICPSHMWFKDDVLPDRTCLSNTWIRRN